MKSEDRNPKHEGNSIFRIRILAVTMCLCAASVFSAATNTPPAKLERAPETPREFFNAGTRMLNDGKLREAEAYLQTALNQQDERLQPAALYNLGHTRFAQGVQELKKAAGREQTVGRARRAVADAGIAMRTTDMALAGTDVDQMVDAYLQGRGARRELNRAIKAVRKAMEVYGSVLLKWQRAAGDFESAAELNPASTNAQQNAEIVKRRIAWLIDQIREMQQAMMAMAQAKQQLGEKMKQLRGRIPDENMPPGAPGDGDDEDEGPNGPQPGMSEAPAKQGEEMPISPDEAARILDSFRLDGNRRLPMGQGEEGKPNNPNRPTW